MPRPVVLCRALVVVALTLVLAAPASALSPRRTAAELGKSLRAAGSASGAMVVDLGTGETVFSSRADVRRMPASVEKLWTTSTALLTLGEDATLRTDVTALGPIAIDGTLDGDLYLEGGGDPTLTTAGVKLLARDLVRRTGLTRVTGVVRGDESAFDTLRGVPSAGFRISVDVEPLGALMVDRGRTGKARPYYQADPAAFAATTFAKALRGLGVKVRRTGRAGTAPPGALTLATRRSPTVAQIAELANVPSDNFVAEMLIKALGAAEGDEGSTAAGAAVVEDTIGDEIGVDPTIVDGSGLSRSDRSTPRQVIRLLTGMQDRPEGAALFDSLAIAGRSGTLETRLRTSVARDRCRGKTGTLHDVSNLAGYCDTPSGDRLAFAILMNRVYPSSARSLQDKMVSLIARYEPSD